MQTSPPTIRDSTDQRLAREIGLHDGVAIVAGTIVGSRIFLVPSVIAQQISSLAVVLLIWALALYGFRTSLSIDDNQGVIV